MSTTKDLRKKVLTRVPKNRLERITAQFTNEGALEVNIKEDPPGSRRFTVTALFPRR